MFEKISLRSGMSEEQTSAMFFFFGDRKPTWRTSSGQGTIQAKGTSRGDTLQFDVAGSC